MKEIRYTETQKEIIANREALGALFYYYTNGLCDALAAEHERLIGDVTAYMIDKCNKLRQSQQETFDRMPWLGNMCGRV